MNETEKKTLLENELKEYPTVLEPTQVAEILSMSDRSMSDYIKRVIVEKNTAEGEYIIPFFALDPTKQRRQYRVNKADLISYMLYKRN